MAKEKSDSLSVITEINKKFGEGSLFKLSERDIQKVEAFSTGSLGLDAALGVGGIARGRLTEVFGGEAAGKSSLCLSVIADAQAKGYSCAIVDAEHTLDTNLATILGVDLDSLFVSQPLDGNQSLEITKALIESGQFAVVVVDSVTALVPEQETSEGFAFGNASVGLHARLMSQACRVLSPLASDKNTALIFTNQLREKIGAMGYGDNTTTTGGRALKFFASQRIELKKIQQIKENDTVVGHIIKAKVVKNKVARPYLDATYEITYGKNAVQLNEVIALGIEYGYIKRTGSYYTLDEFKVQGSAKLKLYLEENVEVFQDLRSKVKESLLKYVVNGEKREKKGKTDGTDSE